MRALPSAACVGILLAAGHGRRYAADAPGQDKLMARLEDGTPVAVASARALGSATSRTIAVLRPDQAALGALLQAEGCELIMVGANADGMGDSLATAARHLLGLGMGRGEDFPPEGRDVHAKTQGLPAASSCLVALADMPWLRADTCMQVAAAAPHHRIVTPTWQGKRGHPVAFARDLWPELAALSGDVGARRLLLRHPVHELAVDDPGVHADVDTPQDLRAGH
ncbi:NTP transferase domain-containing protein [Achromobacter sp. ES-001]|uniref:nucleotidyltransferase family protein n=1 Tax=Achromobacter sp. ES-001 TaxID=2860286 RepID=UPI0021058474|nr:nucleotidyltransferase family protein [Achromobacter sp. ES-001]